MKAILRVGATVVLALALATSLRAQTAEVGLTGGWVRPTLAGSEVQNASARNTVGGGAFLTLHLSPAFALQPEVLYLNKGAQGSEQGTSVEFRLGYIEVPVLARLTFPIEGSRVRPHIFAGPAVAFRSKCEVNASEAGVSLTMACDDPNMDAPLKSVDWSITGGAGLSVPLGKISGLLEARYDYGLTKIDNSSAAADVKNRAFMVFAGVSVPVGNLGRAATERTR